GLGRLEFRVEAGPDRLAHLLDGGVEGLLVRGEADDGALERLLEVVLEGLLLGAEAAFDFGFVGGVIGPQAGHILQAGALMRGASDPWGGCVDERSATTRSWGRFRGGGSGAVTLGADQDGGEAVDGPQRRDDVGLERLPAMVLEVAAGRVVPLLFGFVPQQAH